MNIPPRCSWRTCRNPATHDITAGQPGRGDGYATSYACAEHASKVVVRNARIAGDPSMLAVTVRELDQPTQPTLL